MARPFREIGLGRAEAAGRDAIGQYIHFKGLVRARLNSSDGAWLEMIPVDGTVDAVVRFDPHIPGAELWANRVSDAAPDLWAEVSRGRGEESAKERCDERSPETGDGLTDLLAFAVVTSVAVATTVVGSHWLDEQLRRYYREECEGLER